MSDSALIVIPMTYEHRCETNRFASRNGPSAFAGFSVSSVARNETTQPPSTGGGPANASDLRLCPQKLRKGALKQLEDLLNYMILIGLRSWPTRALKSPSALVSNGLRGEEYPSAVRIVRRQWFSEGRSAGATSARSFERSFGNLKN